MKIVFNEELGENDGGDASFSSLHMKRTNWIHFAF